MNTMKNIFAAVMIAAAITASSSVGAVEVKPHHQAIGKDCAVCHTQENAVAGNAFVVPSDKACTSCHGGSTSAARGLYLIADSSYKALVNVPADLSPEGMPFVTPGDSIFPKP